MKHSSNFVVLLFVFFLFSSGCGHIPYKIDVDQGNLSKDFSSAKLSQGMSKQQVIDLIGRPLLKDPFHANRWDYIHHTINGTTQTRTKSNLILIFENNRLKSITEE